jgi:hypothetical protein
LGKLWLVPLATVVASQSKCGTQALRLAYRTNVCKKATQLPDITIISQRQEFAKNSKVVHLDAVFDTQRTN